MDLPANHLGPGWRKRFAQSLEARLVVSRFKAIALQSPDCPTLLVAALVTAVLVPAVDWLRHFIIAPYQLLRDENKRLQQQTLDATTYITDLTAKLEAATVVKRDAITIAASLVSFREGATHTLLNRPVKNSADLETLKADIAEWEKNVIAFMERENVPIGRISTFRVLGTYNARVTGGFNEEHNRELAMLWARMGRLLDIVNDVAT